MTQITVPELLQLIGEQQVQIVLLQREIARLTPKEPATVGPEAMGPRPVAVER